jgi:DNA-binding HxlR family transcriptional regulator
MVLSQGLILNHESGKAVKLSAVSRLATIRLLLFVHSKGEVRYGELGRLISSRGTLSVSLKELEEEGLIMRRVISSRPIQSHYSLTEDGTKIATLLKEVVEILKDN